MGVSALVGVRPSAPLRRGVILLRVKFDGRFVILLRSADALHRETILRDAANAHDKGPEIALRPSPAARSGNQLVMITSPTDFAGPVPTV